MIRESLEGAWKEVEVKLEGEAWEVRDGMGGKGGEREKERGIKEERGRGRAKGREGERSVWRRSEVEVLDMTGLGVGSE